MQDQEYKLVPLYGRDGIVAYAKVDPEDYALVNDGKHWHVTRNGYAARTQYARVDGKRKQWGERMHRLILGMPRHTMAENGKRPEVDHINRDKLDNRKANLRICTRAENMQNRASHRGSTSKHRNVHFCKRTNKWAVQVTLGRYETEEEAAEIARSFREMWMPFAND